jgi:hypothetical protein
MDGSITSEFVAKKIGDQLEKVIQQFEYVSV